MRMKTRELWEGCGFRWLPNYNHSYYGKGNFWKYPNGHIEHHLPELTLDNLFKYFVIPRNVDVDFELYNDDCVAELVHYSESGTADKDKPAEALAQAILEVLRNEQKKL